jgi:DNA-binding response OmpR family regulator
MGTKSILLAVTEPQMLVDITQALGPGWETASAGNELDALAQVEKRPFDAVLVDFNLGSPDASDLLNQALEKHPKITRFLFAYEADLALVAAKVNGTPHILPKPIEPASLKNRIENGVRDSDSKESTSEPANAPDFEAAKIPPIYAEVLKALESPTVTNEQLGEIIGRDAALTSEIFRLTNPSYLGLPRNITRPVEAVESLGLEVVKGVVMALQFLAEHKRL